MQSLKSLGLRPYGLIFGALFVGALLMVGGCSQLSTTGENFAGVNYGEYHSAEGERWIIAGGKDGTNVSLKVEVGDKTITYSADNLDATSVLAQANKAQQERIDALTTFILSTISPVPGPAQ